MKLTPIQRLVTLAIANSPKSFVEILTFTGTTPNYLLRTLSALTRASIITRTSTPEPLYTLTSADSLTSIPPR
jgi:hypothetical protein